MHWYKDHCMHACDMHAEIPRNALLSSLQLQITAQCTMHAGVHALNAWKTSWFWACPGIHMSMAGNGISYCLHLYYQRIIMIVIMTFANVLCWGHCMVYNTNSQKYLYFWTMYLFWYFMGEVIYVQGIVAILCIELAWHYVHSSYNIIYHNNYNIAVV